MPRRRQPAQPRVRLDFSETLADALRAKGLALERVAHRLDEAGCPVSTATLSYWQTGRSLPARERSLHAVVQLEEILELEAGTLTTLLPDSAVRSWQGSEQVRSRDIVDQLMQEWGLGTGLRVTTLFQHDHLWLSRDLQESVVTVRQVMQVEVDNLETIACAYEQAAGAPPRVEPLFGCEVGREEVVPERGLVVCELVLPRPFHRGDQIALTAQVHWGPTGPEDNALERVLPNTARALVLSAHFDGKPPSAARRCEMSARSKYEESISEEVPVLGHEIQTSVVDAKAGIHGLVWDW